MVAEQGEQPGDPLDDLAILDELGWDLLTLTIHWYGSSQVVFADPGAHFVDIYT